MIPFEHRLRVYWEDTDAGGVVFYANYLKFFERARTEWLRAAGIGQQQWRDETGLMFVVSASQVDYLSPARLDDELRITVDPVVVGRVSLTVDQQALRGDVLLARGQIRIGCVRAADLKPQRMPADLLAALTI